jgi:putative GTP pyrophosphokinase
MKPEELTIRYKELRSKYETLTDTTENLLRRLLDVSSIEFFAIETRTKTTDSFDEKVQREDKTGKYIKLEDVTDLSGIRIIAYLQEDCEKICDLIES